MSRPQRKISKSGTYHVTIRGVNKQDIFEGKRDYSKFLEIIADVKTKGDFDIYAYCLMSNHVHLLLNVKNEPLSCIIGEMESHYASWFNYKYERIGPLYQGRFYSEPVDDQKYLLTAWRYILQNPMKAGLERFPGEEYPWSSIYGYYGAEDEITETTKLTGMFENLSDLRHFLEMNGKDDRAWMDIRNGGKLNDEAAVYLLREISGSGSLSDFQRLPLIAKLPFIKEMNVTHHVPIKQISRITGMPRRTIHRALGKSIGWGQGPSAHRKL